MSSAIHCTPLGQAGFRLSYGGATLYLDPYLSDSVERAEGRQARRLVPIWKEPRLVTDADFVLITHAHLDHCDPDTLLPLAKASPKCRFIAPSETCSRLEKDGISASRLTPAPTQWLSLNDGVRVVAVPAAHPTLETDAAGGWRCVGYVIEFGGRRVYHSGDTFVTTPIVEHLERLKPIDVAILPVNEHNYFRERMGIVGNMSMRDAFGLAQLLGVRTLVPMHWDMFAANTVYREEFELYHRLAAPPFALSVNPSAL